MKKLKLMLKQKLNQHKMMTKMLNVEVQKQNIKVVKTRGIKKENN